LAKVPALEAENAALSDKVSALQAENVALLDKGTKLEAENAALVAARDQRLLEEKVLPWHRKMWLRDASVSFWSATKLRMTLSSAVAHDLEVTQLEVFLWVEGAGDLKQSIWLTADSSWVSHGTVAFTQRTEDRIPAALQPMLDALPENGHLYGRAWVNSIVLKTGEHVRLRQDDRIGTGADAFRVLFLKARE